MAFADITVKRRMGPVLDRGNESVFHRIEIAISEMALEIALITHVVFPIPALPNAAFGSRVP